METEPLVVAFALAESRLWSEPESATWAAGRLGNDAADLAADACSGGHCPCFVAGTLVATAILAGAVPAYAQAPPPDIASFNTSPAETALVLDHRAIEELQVGDRVITMPGLRGETDSRTAVTDQWQVIDLEVIAHSTEQGWQTNSPLTPQGGADAEHVVVLTVLRPPGWLASMDADGDRTFELELNELRLRGLAHVINVRGPPQVADAPGRVVLSTIEHRVESVLALSFDDASEVVTTPNHPFYSVSRGWTSAGELQLGEAVETPDGERTLVFAEYEGAAQSVFNLEVEGDHEYLVGDSGIRVHNTYGEDRVRETIDRARRERGGRPPRRRAQILSNEDEIFEHLARHNGIDPNVASARLHDIKDEFARGGADNVLFTLSGDVFSPETGEWLGSLTSGGR